MVSHVFKAIGKQTWIANEMDFEIEMRSEEHNKSQEFIRIGTFRSVFMCVYVWVAIE